MSLEPEQRLAAVQEEDSLLAILELPLAVDEPAAAAAAHFLVAAFTIEGIAYKLALLCCRWSNSGSSNSAGRQTGLPPPPSPLSNHRPKLAS